MPALSFIISTAMMLPFFLWGIYTLRIRFRYHEEFAPKVEVFTLLGVVVFMGVEVVLLRTWMTDTPVLYLFTILGLCVATTALYGAMMVSLASHFMVDMVLPAEPEGMNAPHFAPAEALEHLGDYDAALQEYLVIARIFPKDAATAQRVGNCLIRLDRSGEAASAFERGLALQFDEEGSLKITNRLAEIYERRLDRPDEALRVLQVFIEKFPESQRVETIQSRMDRLRETAAGASSHPRESQAVPPGDLSV